MISLFGAKLSGFYPRGEVRQILYILFREYLGMSKTDIHLAYSEILPAETWDRFIAAVEALETGVPVQYVTGFTEFNGKRLVVNPFVLIPRPETEELCLLASDDFNQRGLVPETVLDLGTGSGCIAIDIKSRFPGSKVTAVDISPEALSVAAENAGRLGLQIRFHRASLLDPASLECLNGPFSLIISNPPYVTLGEKGQIHTNVREHEPELALFVSDGDPLVFYKAICTYASRNLEPGGRLFLEINSRFGEEMIELATGCGLAEAHLYRDIHGKDRFVSATRQE